MSWLSRLLRSRTLDRELDRELRAHLDLMTDDLIRSGVAPEEARRQAAIALGGVEQVKEASRDARGTRLVQDWWQDTRYAVRSLRRAPGFSLAAILTLAVGIGANTAVWSVMDAVMFRSLPVERSEELYALRYSAPSGDDPSYLFSYPGMGRLRGVLPDSIPISGMGSIVRMYVAAAGRAEPMQAQLVSGNWFQMLGVGAARGRLLNPGDDDAGSPPVAVLSHAYWDRQFGRDPAIVGGVIRLNGFPLTVAGVVEPEFGGLTVGLQVDLWIPLRLQPEVRYSGGAWSRDANTEEPWLPQDGIAWLTLVTRTPAGAFQQTEARLAGQYKAELLERNSDTSDAAGRARRLRAQLMLEPLAKGFSPLRQAFADPLQVLMVGVGLVLLIACANLAGLLIARGAARSQEASVRVALGARAGRLFRQSLTESLTLALAGGLVSLLVAWWGGHALVRAASAGPQPIPLTLALDTRVLGFAALLSVVTGLLLGLAPAWRAARAVPFGSFQAGGRIAARSLHRLPMGRLLVVSQIALSLVLLAAAGLFVRTLRNFLAVDTGYAAEQVLEARIDPRGAGYSQEALPGLYQRLLDAVRVIPGVSSVSLSMHGLGVGAQRISEFTVPGVDRPPEFNRQGQENFVTPGYFATVGMVMLRGRAFTDADRLGGPRVAVASEAFARHFFGTLDVVGKRFGYGQPQFEIVGVVRDARVNAIKQRPTRMIYRPLNQVPEEYVQSVEARAEGAPAEVARMMRFAIASVDPDMPVREVVPVAELLSRGLSRERLLARLAGVFGVMALLLAAIGLYGVVAYSVAQRTNELGIRIALGARPGAVRAMVLRDSLAMVLTGLALGILLWLPLQGLVRKLVFGLSPRDPATLVTAAMILSLVGMLAAALPASRAARVDPAQALRAQ
jgi:predicted permease